MLFYNTCLLINIDSSENFGIARFQTNNILNVEIEAFIIKEEIEIIKAKFKAKIQIMLKTSISGNFNNYCIAIEDEFIMIV